MLVRDETMTRKSYETNKRKSPVINEPQMTKRHQLESAKHDVLKHQIVSYLITETLVKQPIVQSIQDDIALTVPQVNSLVDIYKELSEENQFKLTKVVKLNLRTKKEKSYWEALSDQEKAFVSLFMSDDQRKRYEQTLDVLNKS